MAKPLQRHTLTSLKARCVEEGTCLIWHGYHGTGRTPMVYTRHRDAKGNRSGRMVPTRWLMALLSGNAEAKAETAPGATKGLWRTTCGTPGCVAPQHIIRLDMVAHMVDIAANQHKNAVASALRAARISSTKRRQAGKADDEAVKTAIADPRSCAAVARELGVSKTAVANWRRRAKATTAASLWGQLTAR